MILPRLLPDWPTPVSGFLFPPRPTSPLTPGPIRELRGDADFSMPRDGRLLSENMASSWLSMQLTLLATGVHALIRQEASKAGVPCIAYERPAGDTPEKQGSSGRLAMTRPPRLPVDLENRSCLRPEQRTCCLMSGSPVEPGLSSSCASCRIRHRSRPVS